MNKTGHFNFAENRTFLLCLDNFLNISYEAVKNTILNDRAHIFDSTDNLYTGEQSFLDWREQTYPQWTADDTVHLAMSKTLSTNVLHYIILDAGSKLAELKGDNAFKNECDNWKNVLKNSIVENFYLSDDKLFSSMKTTYLNNIATKKFDMLGTALAILSGVADEEKAKNALANYPVTEAGPPVIWPQEPSTRVYHNRAVWPFVTGYALKAAIKTKNDLSFINSFMSIVRGAALNLSNMENLEFTTLSNYFEDTRKDFANRDLSGPVVNSRRQLWSVAAFVSLVKDGLLGMDLDRNSITFDPLIPVLLKNTFFVKSDEIVLSDLKIRGKNIKATLIFPEKGEKEDGFFVFEKLELNGLNRSKNILLSELKEENVVEITLKQSGTGGQITKKECSNEKNCFAPHAPEIPLNPYGVSVKNGKLQVAFTGENGVSFNVYRDGVKVAENVAASPWVDENSADYMEKSYCYTVSALNSSGLESHIANPVCFWGTSFERVTEIKAENFEESPNAFDHGKPHFADWGNVEATLSTSFSPSLTGTYLVQIEYGSGRPIDTGITCSFKKVEFIDKSNSETVATGFIAMPHLGADNWDRWENSSFIKVELQSGKDYKILIADGLNMSYFKHFIPYTGGAAGGGETVYNRVNLSAVKLLMKEIKK
ncbi:MAG: hypothetical protein ACOX2F_01240 [bacterium]